jgi:hypothetical protein
MQAGVLTDGAGPTLRRLRCCGPGPEAGLSSHEDPGSETRTITGRAVIGQGGERVHPFLRALYAELCQGQTESMLPLQTSNPFEQAACCSTSCHNISALLAVFLANTPALPSVLLSTLTSTGRY